jgi:hypothetical protein
MQVKSLDDFLDLITDDTERKAVRQFADKFGVRGNEQLEAMFMLMYMKVATLQGLSDSEAKFRSELDTGINKALGDIVDVTEGAAEALHGSLESLMNHKVYEAKEVATGLTEQTNVTLQKFIDTFTNLAVFLDESEKGMQKRYELRMAATDKSIETMHAQRMELAESKVEELVSNLAAKVVPPILEKVTKEHLDRLYRNHKLNTRELMDAWTKKRIKRDFAVWFSATLCAGLVVSFVTKFFH